MAKRVAKSVRRIERPMPQIGLAESTRGIGSRRLMGVPSSSAPGCSYLDLEASSAKDQWTVQVAWVIYGSLDQATGGYVYDRLIVRELLRMGHRVAIVSLDPGARGRELRSEPALRGADVIVVDGLCTPDVCAALEALLGARIVLLVHHLSSWEVERTGSRQGHEHQRAAEKELLERADHWVTTSRATAARLVQEHDAATQVSIVPPGADRLRRAPRAEPTSDVLRLLSVGALIPRKRILSLLAAVESCRFEGLMLRIVGDDQRDMTYAGQVDAAIAASPRLRSRVCRLGAVDDARLALEFSVADFLVLASSLEGYGMVLTEARAAGLPQIVARSAALPEVRRDGDDMVVFDGETELAKVLEELGKSAVWRRKLASAAAARIPSLRTWSTAGAAFEEVLQATARQSRIDAAPNT